MRQAQRLCLLILLITFSMNIAKATDFLVKYTIDLDGGCRKLVAPLSDFEILTPQHVQIKKLSGKGKFIYIIQKKKL